MKSCSPLAEMYRTASAPAVRGRISYKTSATGCQSPAESHAPVIKMFPSATSLIRASVPFSFEWTYLRDTTAHQDDRVQVASTLSDHRPCMCLTGSGDARQRSRAYLLADGVATRGSFRSLTRRESAKIRNVPNSDYRDLPQNPWSYVINNASRCRPKIWGEFWMYAPRQVGECTFPRHLPNGNTRVI